MDDHGTGQRVAINAAGNGVVAWTFTQGKTQAVQAAFFSVDAPGVGGFDSTRNAFRVSGSPTPKTARAPKGTAFVYSLSQRATARIEIQRRKTGRRFAGQCVRPVKALRKAKRCKRYVKLGTLTRPQEAGPQSVLFSGRIGTKPLKAATYRAQVQATNQLNQTSEPKRTYFKIVKR